jgi:hypothetical protein
VVKAAETAGWCCPPGAASRVRFAASDKDGSREVSRNGCPGLRLAQTSLLTRCQRRLRQESLGRPSRAIEWLNWLEIPQYERETSGDGPEV